MAELCEDAVRALAGFQGGRAPVTSCYVDVDGRRLPTHADVQRELGKLVRAAGLNGHSRVDAPASVRRDVHRIEQYVRGLTRGSTRGLALFSCTDQDLWEVFELPVRVTSQLVVEPTPCVRQLEAVLEDYERIGVLLVDRQRSRLFVFELGELVEHTEHVDQLARHSDDDRGERVKTRQGSQLSEQYLQRVRRAAQLAFDVYQRVGFDHLAIGAPAEVRSELEPLLHPYLRARLAEPIGLGVGASLDQVKRAALEIEQRLERAREAILVTQLRAAVQSGGKAVVGLDATLRALGEQRVDRLFVSEGYQAEGWRCGSCGRLATVGRRCPTCGAEMRKVPDVVEAAVAGQLANNGRVEVCLDNPDLDVLGRAGALLRY